MTRLSHQDLRRNFRQLLASDTCYHTASVFDPMSARIAADLGFEVGILGGSVASLQVLGDDGPLFAGQGFEEDIHAGGRSGHLRWRVEEYLPGHRWRASARGEHGLHLQLSYECQPLAAARTRFVRTLEYRFDNRLMRLGNQLLFKRRIERESAASLLALCKMAQQAIPLPAADAAPRSS